MRKLTHVLGVPFDAVTMDEAVAKAKKLLKEEGQHITRQALFAFKASEYAR